MNRRTLLARIAALAGVAALAPSVAQAEPAPAPVPKFLYGPAGPTVVALVEPRSPGAWAAVSPEQVGRFIGTPRFDLVTRRTSCSESPDIAAIEALTPEEYQLHCQEIIEMLNGERPSTLRWSTT